MKTRTAFERLQGSASSFWFANSFAALRIVIGFQFLFAGLDKFTDWSAEGYLLGASGPFAAFFQSLAGSVLVDQLNIWGLTLIGIALILGLMVRPAAFFAAVMMLFYYFAHFVENTAHGIIDEHIIYLFVFLVFTAGGAGHVFGLDAIASRYMAKRKKLASLLFG